MNLSRPITGRDVLFGFVAFFVLIFMANAALVYLALNSWTGLETEQAYARGVAYNRVLDADARQRELGWQSRVTVAVLPDGRVQVDVGLFDKRGVALRDLTVNARFIRPTHQGSDFSLPLRSVGEGRYVASFTPSLRGQWTVHVAAKRGEQTHVAEERVVLR